MGRRSLDQQGVKEDVCLRLILLALVLLFGLHTSIAIDMSIFLELKSNYKEGCGLQYFFENPHNGTLISLQFHICLVSGGSWRESKGLMFQQRQIPD